MKKSFLSTFIKFPAKSGRLVQVLKWLLVLVAYSFLAYKLLTFHQYSQLLNHWKNMPLIQFSWLFFVFLLLPINWLLESIKWKLLTAHVQKISLKTSIKSVLAGISTGFFTPNRIGELVGRLMFLDSENRKPGVTLCVLSSMSQNIILTLFGVPACILFFSSTSKKIDNSIVQYLAVLVGFLIVFGVIYFLLPTLSRLLQRSRYWIKIKDFTDCLSAFIPKDLVQIMLIAFARFFIFCVQFFLMLRFFGIELSGWQALISIPTMYLFITFTPSIAFSDAAVRSSIAVLIIGTFSTQIVNIALTGMCIWLINFVIPMLAGSVMLMKKSE